MGKGVGNDPRFLACVVCCASLSLFGVWRRQILGSGDLDGVFGKDI
jgi:hypothetical protein